MRNKGATLIEYALLAAIIVLCSVNAVKRFRTTLISRTTELSDDYPAN